MHRAHRMANEAGVTNSRRAGAGSSPREVHQALLLASAQPASFTLREIDVVVDYILALRPRINLIAATEGMTDARHFPYRPGSATSPPSLRAQAATGGRDVPGIANGSLQLAEEQVAAL